MKLVKAIIRPEKLNDVLKALFQADVRGSRFQGSRVTEVRPALWQHTEGRRS